MLDNSKVQLSRLSVSKKTLSQDFISIIKLWWNVATRGILSVMMNLLMLNSRIFAQTQRVYNNQDTPRQSKPFFHSVSLIIMLKCCNDMRSFIFLFPWIGVWHQRSMQTEFVSFYEFSSIKRGETMETSSIFIRENTSTSSHLHWNPRRSICCAYLVTFFCVLLKIVVPMLPVIYPSVWNNSKVF